MLQALKAALKPQPAIFLPWRSLQLAMGSFSEKEIRLLPFVVHPAKVAIDVGAWDGIYTHALLKLGVPVVAIEANPKAAAILARLYGRKARIVCAAASSSAGKAKLRVPRRGSVGIATVEARNTLSSADVDEIEVPQVALDDIDLEPVGFIKIDVEGHELDVLLGAKKLLARDHPAILVEAEERHRPGGINSIFEMLSSLGYHGFFLDSGRLSPISHFDAVRDQLIPTNRLDDLNFGRYEGRYINNFLFVA
jgi:FkbM family methyltransferase